LPLEVLNSISSAGKIRVLLYEGATMNEGKVPSWVNGGFYGTCSAKFMSRSRLRLPLRFRDAFCESAVVTPSLLEDSIWIFSDQRDAEEYVRGVFGDRFGGYDPDNRFQATLYCRLKGQLYLFDIPRDYTFSLKPIPPDAPIGANLVLVGVGDHIEVYPRSTWHEILAADYSGLNAAKEAGV